ncbi:MAG: FtsQ-type POTRA domain-containing protein [Peptoniphilaceae bacterium]|nr:FtsQ-type POTRA domain-containing protein [Peptoniphilaceae bacterium]MDY6018141.1 FtsQ-type POTRA domain-containing protein [Anaerococcus sp.]
MVNSNKNRRRLSDKSKKNKGIFTIPLFIFLLVISLIIIAYNAYNHTYFKVSQVFVKGNVMTSDEEILKLIGNPVGKSIFTYDNDRAEEILKQEDNIKNAKVIKEYPDIIQIKIEEIYPYMYTAYEGKTYIISNTGEVLNNPKTNKELVKLKAKITSPKVGHSFTEDKDLLKFLKKLQTYYYANQIEELNLEKKDDIGIIIKGIHVIFGDINDADYKLKLLDSVLKDIDQKGVNVKKIDLTKGKSPVVEVKDNSLNEDNN